VSGRTGVCYPFGGKHGRYWAVKRREFITLLGGAATWPLAARAQQAERMRRIGAFTGLAADDSVTKARLAAFRQELERLGWSEGRNVHIDYRFGGGRSDQYLSLAREMVGLRPEVILAQSTQFITSLQRETRAIPIVFTEVSDPVGAGFIASLARPGGNLTGVLLYEAGMRSERPGDVRA